MCACTHVRACTGPAAGGGGSLLFPDSLETAGNAASGDFLLEKLLLHFLTFVGETTSALPNSVWLEEMTPRVGTRNTEITSS